MQANLCGMRVENWCVLSHFPRCQSASGMMQMTLCIKRHTSTNLMVCLLINSGHLVVVGSLSDFQGVKTWSSSLLFFLKVNSSAVALGCKQTYGCPSTSILNLTCITVFFKSTFSILKQHFILLAPSVTALSNCSVQIYWRVIIVALTQEAVLLCSSLSEMRNYLGNILELASAVYSHKCIQ